MCGYFQNSRSKFYPRRAGSILNIGEILASYITRNDNGLRADLEIVRNEWFSSLRSNITIRIIDLFAEKNVLIDFNGANFFS